MGGWGKLGFTKSIYSHLRYWMINALYITRNRVNFCRNLYLALQNGKKLVPHIIVKQTYLFFHLLLILRSCKLQISLEVCQAPSIENRNKSLRTCFRDHLYIETTSQSLTLLYNQMILTPTLSCMVLLCKLKSKL